MKRFAIAVCIAAATMPGLASHAAPPGLPFSQQDLESKTKITMQQATSIALKARPGKITDSDLERVAGGSGLRYAFDIDSGGHTYEVDVDAVTGKVLENDLDTD